MFSKFFVYKRHLIFINNTKYVNISTRISLPTWSTYNLYLVNQRTCHGQQNMYIHNTLLLVIIKIDMENHT